MSGAPRLVLAVDAGGSATRAVVVGPDGTCHGYGTGPAGNPTSSGPEDAVRAVAAAARAALLQARRPAAAVGAVLLAMAGSRGPEPPPALAQELGLLAGTPVQVVSDILAMYSSGAVEPDGCAVVAGTGSVAARVAGGDLVRVFDGCGWLLGDGGSGFAVGRDVVRAVVGDLDGLGPATALTGLLLADLGIGRDDRMVRGRPAALDRLVAELYLQRPVTMARFAPLAFAAADGAVAPGEADPGAVAPGAGAPDAGAPDAVAVAVVARAQDEVAALVAAGRGGSSGPLVLGGSVMLHGFLAPGRPLSPALEEALAGADVRHARDGAVGAAVAGLRLAGHPVTEEVLGRLRRSTAELQAVPGSPGTGAGRGTG